MIAINDIYDSLTTEEFREKCGADTPGKFVKFLITEYPDIVKKLIKCKFQFDYYTGSVPEITSGFYLYMKVPSRRYIEKFRVAINLISYIIEDMWKYKRATDGTYDRYTYSMNVYPASTCQECLLQFEQSDLPNQFNRICYHGEIQFFPNLSDDGNELFHTLCRFVAM